MPAAPTLRGSGSTTGAARAGGLDVRLALAAALAWVAVALLVGGSAGRALWTAAGFAALGLLALLLGRRLPSLASVVALAAFCVVLVLAPLAARLAAARGSELARLAGAHVPMVAYLTVSADPRLLSPKGVAGAPRAVIEATLTGASVAGRSVAARGPVLVLGPAALWRDVLPGQRVRLDVVAQPSLGGDLLQATLSAQGDPTLLGAPPWWQRAAGDVRAKLRVASAQLPADVAGLLPGLIDGDTTGLDPVLAEKFRVAGLTHLVAVSGANCAVVTGAVLLVLRRARAGPRTCALVAALVVVAFVIVARPSPSVLRAALMAGITLLAMASGRQRDVLPTLSATVVGLLLWQPGLAIDYGFAMSVLATAALVVIAPGWADALRRRRVPIGLAEPVAVAAAAHVVTAPVVAAISGTLSLVAIPANFLAEPIVAITTVFGFVAAVTAPFSLGVGSAFVWLAGWPCRWLIAVADYFGGLQGATLPWPGGLPGGLALLAVSLAIARVCRRAGPRHVLAVVAVVVVVVQIPVRSVVSGWPATGWLFVACDVGQGDALVLPAGPHSAVVIDAGPDAVSVDRCLHDLSITDVPLLIFSHYHLDHVGGVAGVFHGRSVHAAITGPLALPATGVDLVRTTLAAHGLAIGQATAGLVRQVGGVGLEFLAPSSAFHGTRSDPNNSSLVVRATVRGRTIMLAGDAEVEAQRSLVDSGLDLRADILKVPHHGSAYSEPAFLAGINARIGIISVGAHNDYGLPSQPLLAELSRIGVPVRRTDQDGDIAVLDSSGQLSVVARGVRASSVG